MKIVLFASLMLAMILPLSAVDYATASNGESDTRSKTLEHIDGQIAELNNKKIMSVDESDDLKMLELAKKFLNAKQNNETELIAKYSKELQNTLPENYMDSLSPTVKIELPITPMWTYDTFTGNTVYSWDCRDDSDLTGYVDGSITGYSTWTYMVGNYHYPPEETVGPQGIQCAERDFEDGKVVYQELLNWSVGCVEDNYTSHNQQIGSSCDELSSGSLVYLHAHPEYETNLEFSPTPSNDIVYLG